MRALSVIVVAGCWTSAPDGRDVHGPEPPQANRELVMTNESFGPLDASSPGTLAYVRAHFPDLDVRAANSGASLEYQAFAGSDELFFVVTDESLSILDVQATSPRVISRWRVGSAFHDGRLISTCECWGENPTCYHRGEHIAVNFDIPCFGAVDARDFTVLDGQAPQRVIWSPKPFGSREIDGVDDVRNVDPSDGSDDDDDGF
jgi:hypothetical protein